MRVKIIILKWCFGKKISASPCAKSTLDYVNKLENTKKHSMQKLWPSPDLTGWGIGL